MRRELIRTTRFVRAVRRHLKKRRHAAANVRQTLEILAADAFDPRLKTHKLTGELEGVWACSAGYDLRILFEFVQVEGNEAILLLTMGTHDEVY
ncbi:MAG TPA: type II toxin-antitoxin system YafQ family toxin [Lacipirellulaceae bacterium]|nr:type II toxin-antitoxin system YafQ family toxin [Lacipirellulaceae bacterium]